MNVLFSTEGTSCHLNKPADRESKIQKKPICRSDTASRILDRSFTVQERKIWYFKSLRGD